MARSPSILVVDDDPALRDTMRFLLELEGYRVQAVTAPVAMALIVGQRPDLVLLDLDMPLLDGKDVHDFLLADPATAGIPVVTMGELGRLEKQPALKVQGSLAKPLNYRDLMAEVARQLQYIL